MAYTYKQIGTSAAAVASILAVGTLLWYQRTTSPDMPHPQDEAAIMHADLERSYGMARPRQYTYTIAANVSKILSSNVWTNAVNIIQASSTLTLQGYAYDVLFFDLWWYGEWMMGSGCAFDSTADITLTEVGGIEYGTLVNLYQYYCWDPFYFNGYNFTISHPIGSLWRVDGSAVYWLSPGNLLPQVLSPFSVYDDSPADSSIYGVLTLTANGQIPGFNTPVYIYVTNSPAIVYTNTVGLYPNATFQYPLNIKGDIAPAVLSSGTHHWFLPSNTFWTSGHWDGNLIGSSVNGTNRWSPDWEQYTRDPYGNIHELDNWSPWWTNLITDATAHRVCQTNYWDGKVISWTNGVCSTQQYATATSGSSIRPPNATAGCRSTTNYNYSFTCDPWTVEIVCVGNTTNVVPVKALAFERDNTPYPWSTNAYNDMARPLAMMQWQKVRRSWESALTNYTCIQFVPVTCTNGGEYPTNEFSTIPAWKTNVPPIRSFGSIGFSSSGLFFIDPPSTEGANIPHAFIRMLCYWMPRWQSDPWNWLPELYAFSFRGVVSRSRLIYTPPTTNFLFTAGYFLVDTMWGNHFEPYPTIIDFDNNGEWPVWPEPPGIPPPDMERIPLDFVNMSQDKFVSSAGRVYHGLAPLAFETHGESITSDWVVAYSPPLPSTNWMQAAFYDFVALVYAETELRGHTYNGGDPWQNGKGRFFYKDYGWDTYVGHQSDKSEAYGDPNHAGYVTTHPIFESLTNYLDHAPPR